MTIIVALNACSGNDNSNAGQMPVALGINQVHPGSHRGAKNFERPNTSPYTYVTSTPAPSAEAWCPSGQKAIGGGFSNANADSQTTSSHYVGALHNAWKSLDSGSGSITSYAICVSGSSTTTQYETTAWTQPQSSTQGGLITCGSGYQVSDGGFAMTSGTVGESVPSLSFSGSGPQEWLVGGNPNSSASGTAYAVCVETSNFTSLTTSGSGAATANCPSGDVAVGGGFSAAGNTYPNFLVKSSTFYNSHQSWRVTGTNGPGNEISAYAVCAPGS